MLSIPLKANFTRFSGLQEQEVISIETNTLIKNGITILFAMRKDLKQDTITRLSFQLTFGWNSHFPDKIYWYLDKGRHPQDQNYSHHKTLLKECY